MLPGQAAKTNGRTQGEHDMSILRHLAATGVICALAAPAQAQLIPHKDLPDYP